jgi:hypothetical protein
VRRAAARDHRDRPEPATGSPGFRAQADRQGEAPTHFRAVRGRRGSMVMRWDARGPSSVLLPKQFKTSSSAGNPASTRPYPQGPQAARLKATAPAAELVAGQCRKWQWGCVGLAPPGISSYSHPQRGPTPHPNLGPVRSRGPRSSGSPLLTACPGARAAHFVVRRCGPSTSGATIEFEWRKADAWGEVCSSGRP